MPAMARPEFVFNRKDGVLVNNRCDPYLFFATAEKAQNISFCFSSSMISKLGYVFCFLDKSSTIVLFAFKYHICLSRDEVKH